MLIKSTVMIVFWAVLAVFGELLWLSILVSARFFEDFKTGMEIEYRRGDVIAMKQSQLKLNSGEYDNGVCYHVDQSQR